MPTDLELLDQLRDIIPPADPGIWPPAIGWWVLAILIAVLPFGVWAIVEYVKTRVVRHSLVRQISAVAGLQPHPAAVRLSMLMRKIAVSRYRVSAVAGLTGEAWLEFLDSTGRTDQFTRGPGRLLITAPYDRHRTADIDSLIEVCLNWVRHAD